jgi:dolichol-phosphate mannosyltransferase
MGGATRAAARRSVPILSVVVPSRNEAESVDALIAELEPVIAVEPAELIFVDDSDDETPSRVLEHASRAGGSVRLVHREPHERGGGLGGAVVEGLSRARGAWVCVMDADLQHPPEVVPRLLRAAEADDRELVVATRFRDGGSHLGLGALRTLVSRGSALAARLLFPRRLRGVSDPMSGFFLVRRAAVDLAELKPNGFKILLELLVRTPFESVGEVPYAFAERRAGESKASFREGLRFLLQLVRLRLPDASGRLARFGLIGLSGLVVNESLLALFTERAGFYYLASAVISTQASIMWNFALTERWVYSRRDCRLGWRARLGAFCLVCTTAQVLTIPLLYLLVDTGALPYLIGNLFAIGVSTLLRFTIAERVIWKARPAAVLAPARRSGPS